MLRSAKSRDTSPSPPHCAGEGAFTLTEVLIAVFVLAVGLIGVISVFPVGIDAASKTLDGSAAALATGTALAELQSQQQMSNYVGLSTSVTGYPNASDATETNSIGSTKYSWNAVLGLLPSDWGDVAVSGADTRRIVMAQIAFFTTDASAFTGTATFAKNSQSVTITNMPADLTAGSYIRRMDDPKSRWYLIEAIDESGTDPVATLTAAFDSDSSPGGAENFLYTQTLFQTILTSR